MFQSPSLEVQDQVVDLSYEIHPSNSGLKLVFSEKKYYTKYVYNNFTIEGKSSVARDCNN